MIYTLCWEKMGFAEDIRVNREQKLSETMLILSDGAVMPVDIDFENNHLFSERKGEKIDWNLSYEQADLFNGDILYIRENQEG